MPKSIYIHKTRPSLTNLIEQGIRLWHEEVELRPGKSLEKLWLLASEIMDTGLHEQRAAAIQRLTCEHKSDRTEISSVRLRSPKMMSANEAKLLIVCGSLVPKTWDSLQPYPYQGLFISAFYFLEARNQVEGANAEIAWVLLTQAYYYLGMNSATLSAHESAADAAKSRHANNSRDIRKIIVMILNSARGDAAIRSGAEAISRVLEEMEKNSGYKDVMNAFNVRCEGKKNDVDTLKRELQTPACRLKDRLEEWSLPSGPYPDIVEAFAPFKRGKRAIASKKNKRP